MHCKWPKGVKNGGFCCGFSLEGAKLMGLLISNWASFERRRDGCEEQGAEVVQTVVDKGGNVGKEMPNPTTLVGAMNF